MIGLDQSEYSAALDKVTFFFLLFWRNKFLGKEEGEQEMNTEL